MTDLWTPEQHDQHCPARQGGECIHEDGCKASSAAYAPPREDGLKPWVRESYHFGETTNSIVYAASAADAKGMYARMHLETVRVRRATPEDVKAYA